MFPAITFGTTLSANLAKVAVKDALDNRLVHVWAFTFNVSAFAFVHVLDMAADKGFVCLDLVAFAADLGVSEISSLA